MEKIINLVLNKTQTHLQFTKISLFLMFTLFKLSHLCYEMLVYGEKKSLNFSNGVFVSREKKSQIIIIKHI